jgi:hypothetical protein
VENLSQKGWDWWMMGADLGVGAPTGQANAIAGQGHYPCAKGESDDNFFLFNCAVLLNYGLCMRAARFGLAGGEVDFQSDR